MASVGKAPEIKWSIPSVDNEAFMQWVKRQKPNSEPGNPAINWTTRRKRRRNCNTSGGDGNGTFTPWPFVPNLWSEIFLRIVSDGGPWKGGTVFKLSCVIRPKSVSTKHTAVISDLTRAWLYDIWYYYLILHFYCLALLVFFCECTVLHEAILLNLSIKQPIIIRSDLIIIIIIRDCVSECTVFR